MAKNLTRDIWTGYATLDRLRGVAAMNTGIIDVSIEQLNEIGTEVEQFTNSQAARIAALEAVLRDNEKTLKFACSVANQMRESGLYDACLASFKATRAVLKG